MKNSTTRDAEAAVKAANDAAPGWRALSFDDRAAVILKAADLLAGPWRQRLNAATMLGQSKTAFQAEIDAACELIDFWRFNVAFARQILAEQPVSGPGVWNRVDHRPLEGFVYAITPFNFTAIAGNLPTAPALMGNTVVWKPAAILGELDRAGLLNRGLPMVHSKTLEDALNRWDIKQSKSESVRKFFMAAPGNVPTQVAFSQERRFEELDTDRAEGCIRDAEHAFSRDGGLAVLYGNIALEGSIVNACSASRITPLARSSSSVS